MKRLSFGLLGLVCLWQTVVFAAQPTALYVLQTSRQPKYDVLRLVNSKTKRVIWKQHAFSEEPKLRCLTWSKDKRALVISLGYPNFLVWREGSKPKFFCHVAYDDWFDGFKWSPDKRRLLIFSGGSGSDMTPWTNIECLNIAKRSQYRVGNGEGADWASSRRVFYWQPDNIKDQLH